MTNFDKGLIRIWLKAFALVITVLLMVFMFFVMCGCRTQYIPVENVRTEYLRTDSTLFASILNIMRKSVKANQRSSDSVKHLLKETTTLNEQGDTARHDRIEYIYLSSYKEKEYERIIEEQNDSIEKLNTRLESVKADSVPVPYPVEKQLTKWESTKMDFGGIAFGGMIVAVIVIAILAWMARKRRK